MPDQNQTSQTITAILSKRSDDMRTALLTGVPAYHSELPLDADAVQELMDAAGNALTSADDNVSRRDFAQVQQHYELVRETKQALDIIMHEHSQLDDLTKRDTAAINQLKVVGSELHLGALTRQAQVRR